MGYDFGMKSHCLSWVLIVSSLASFLLGGCATYVDTNGSRHSDFDLRYLAKSDVDRVIETNRASVTDSLHRVADKLYRRNPREWKKAGLTSREAALERLFNGTNRFPELKKRSEGDAVMLAFDPEYSGDRVLAVMAGLNSMVDAAFEHKHTFYMFDDLDAQKLYNCARNVEIAVWKMSSSRTENGTALLVSNELDFNNPNLSFEREFGRIIGLLDFMSLVVADKNGRSVTRLTQSIATSVFLPVGALGFK